METLQEVCHQQSNKAGGKLVEKFSGEEMSCQQKSILDLFSNLSKDHFDQLLSSNTLPFLPGMVLSEYLINMLSVVSLRSLLKHQI